MSTSSHADNAANPKQGAFKPSDPSRGPTNTGYQLGRKVEGTDPHPEYHAQAFPPGAAPASNSYASNPVSAVPGQANDLNMAAVQENDGTYTSPADTLVGATSEGVNRGLGKPMQGETSNELRNNGQHGRKRDTPGLEGVGTYRQNRGVERRFAEQRGLEKEEAVVSGTHGDKLDRPAEQRHPDTA
ncbi:hypothetical protein N7491_009497 [Penicillium cf. griseofulvum]|uniref:Uncharacterized protein n=1 Tax=Penicillium cf. griseofulvum TaxID=2972120 RepID=A0A9W9MEP6_9EURO|nr:hypothetical protein N7472_004909 [Penicillium cf. griseofulvum]KAJ5424281.1 hypothetical protein N7491_009497 [Penicillium cf. griseofulvum]KAJ5442477.1 hypothetical protein N7445_005484 [Penicillium cf. griseofulvum]